jgi:hypothetical protein
MLYGWFVCRWLVCGFSQQLENNALVAIRAVYPLLGRGRGGLIILFVSLCPKETKQRKACRGLTRRLRRGAFFPYKGLLAH